MPQNDDDGDDVWPPWVAWVELACVLGMILLFFRLIDQMLTGG